MSMMIRDKLDTLQATMRRITLTLSDTLYSRYRLAARERGVSTGDYIRLVLAGELPVPWAASDAPVALVKPELGKRLLAAMKPGEAISSSHFVLSRWAKVLGCEPRSVRSALGSLVASKKLVRGPDGRYHRPETGGS